MLKKYSNYMVKEVLPSIHPDYIVICFTDTQTSSNTLIIVWNLEDDEEVSNFSTQKTYFLCNGPNSKIGYLMIDTFYVNLDEGL